MPRPSHGFDPTHGMARLHRVAEDAGRDPATLTVTVFRAPGDAKTLAQYEEAGIDGALLQLPDVPRDELLKQLDAYATLLG